MSAETPERRTARIVVNCIDLLFIALGAIFLGSAFGWLTGVGVSLIGVALHRGAQPPAEVS
jgi:hypothetical protein